MVTADQVSWHATRLSMRTVLITGGGGRLGQAVADAFAELGHRVALFDHVFEKNALSPSERKTSFSVDLLDAKALDIAVSSALAKFGDIDVLCNVAGAFDMGQPVHLSTDEQWDMLFNANALSLVRATRAVVPRMLQRGSGCVVNVGAMAGVRGLPGMGAYCASKSVVERLTESMAAELGPLGIRVNCVLPSILDTPRNRSDMPDADFSRWVNPTDLAQVIVFLASTQATAVHGACIPVHGPG